MYLRADLRRQSIKLLESGNDIATIETCVWVLMYIVIAILWAL